MTAIICSFLIFHIGMRNKSEDYVTTVLQSLHLKSGTIIEHQLNCKNERKTHKAPRATSASTLLVSISRALLYSFMASTWRPCLKWSTPARTLKIRAKHNPICINWLVMRLHSYYQQKVKLSILMLPFQGPGRRLLFPDCRSKIVLFEKLTVKTIEYVTVKTLQEFT